MTEESFPSLRDIKKRVRESIELSREAILESFVARVQAHALHAGAQPRLYYRHYEPGKPLSRIAIVPLGDGTDPGHNGDGGPDKPTGPLSRREMEVLQLLVDGKSTREISGILGVSFKTAASHRANIMAKLDVHETASLVRRAIRWNLVKT